MSYPASGGMVPGYLAVPAGAGPWPGVVVIHEIFGINDDIRRKADEMVSHGTPPEQVVTVRPWRRAMSANPARSRFTRNSPRL